MMVSAKEIDALAWVAEHAELGALHIEEWRNDADIGWVLATFTPIVRHSGGRRPDPKTYRVSPLGHVYDHASDEILREGPAVWPDGQKRSAAYGARSEGPVPGD